MAEGGGDQLILSDKDSKQETPAPMQFLETPEGRRLAYHQLPGEILTLLGNL